MFESGIHGDSLAKQFSEASAKQGEAVREPALEVWEGRELRLKNIREVPEIVTRTASSGAASSPLGTAHIDPLLAKAFKGMDAALLQAVAANRRDLRHLVDQGVGVRETQFKKTLGHIEKMGDTLFAAMGKAVQGVARRLRGTGSA